ncbi:unnamed protein product [Callosobruchus maculatus]|uniref:Protein krueppel n=1 Tax=Callosobruchus maculatus TaxID=64391 RepID=A0A653C211_CALMS|nr:unnamed protein product [Callosobruchus maculatus]
MSKIYTVGTLYIEFYCIFEFPAEQPEAPHYCLSTILLKRNLHIRPLPISSSGVRLVVKMDSTANILQFCRLCLVKDGVNIPIFDEQGDIRQIYLKISSCLPVKVAREDHLPKKICDGCSNKLDICYDFWRTSAESEKQLLAWLGATGKDAAQVNVKEEDNFDEPLASDISKNDDDENKCYMFEQKVEEGPPVEINDEPPPSKRPRRTAAMEDDSDETDGDDREPAFVDVPSTSADDQPGPSGVSKDGSDAPVKREVAMSPLPCLQLRIKPEDVQLHWSCPECLGAFITLEQLFSHSREVHSSDMYHCDVCSKMYREMRQLHQHKQFVHQTAPTYECSECPEIFKTQKQFASHRRMVHIYKCNLCGKKFGLAEMLEIHRKAVHTKEWYYECPLCKEIFKTEEQLCDHLKEMHSPVYPCDVFETKTQLSRHKAAIHYTLIHPCTVCGIIFQEPDKLELHKNCHTNEVQHKKFHTNEEQHMMFQTNEEQHEKSHTNEDQRMEFHTNKEQHKESHTNKQKTSNESNEADATNNDDLKCPDQRVVANSYLPCLQLRVKPEDVQLHWSCPECLGTFNTLEQLFSHSREVHSSDMYHCHLCGKMYQEVEKLHQHKYFMHPTSPTYECSECPEGFETQRQFATHRKMVHTYNCNICGKRFRLAELLEIHRKVVHPQEWYYECSICNAIFKTEEQMCEHLKEIHSPDVYPCDVCKETLQLLKVQRH